MGLGVLVSMGGFCIILAGAVLGLGDDVTAGQKVCNSDNDCINLVCVSGMCVDVCEGACGSNADCSIVNSSSSCTCRAGFSGDPKQGCTLKQEQQQTDTSTEVHLISSEAPPRTQGGCSEDSHCTVSQTCAGAVCVDPCKVPGMCGPNTVCQTDSHRAVCTCQTGFIKGNSWLGCKKKKKFQKFNERVSWWNAREYCRYLGGDLANIVTLQDSRDFEIEHLAKRTHFDPWVGATCIESGDLNTCHWEIRGMRTKFSGFVTNWNNAALPNTSFGAFTDFAHCLTAHLTPSTFSLSPCSNLQSFVCQLYS